MSRFQCQIDGEKQIYDGDTIKDVRLDVFLPELEVGFYIIRDVRVEGIDTPEKRPRKKGRTPESLLREKAAAKVARQAAVDLLENNDFRFTVENAGHGKYAGRVIGRVFVGDINLGDHLIALGHAKRYDGGKKPVWNW